jgi:hypothetical protein
MLYKVFEYFDVEYSQKNDGIRFIKFPYEILTGEVARWVFEKNEFISRDEKWLWENALKNLEDLLQIISKTYDWPTVLISIMKDESSYEFGFKYEKKVKINEACKFLYNFLFNNSLITNLTRVEVKIKVVSECKVDENVGFTCELFEVLLRRNDAVGIDINTSNLCFLPNNPILKLSQYTIWKNNAPKLAKLLSEFNKVTNLNLLSEPGEFSKIASFSENVFYLRNGAIMGVEDPNFDEFQVPFELLEEGQYYT